MTPLIDIGVNLTHRSFQSDYPTVIDDALSAGVGQIILTGTSLAKSISAAEMAQSRPGILFSTVGIHPHDGVHLSQEDVDTIEELTHRPEVVAIGECGLDFNRNYTPRDVQRRCFEQQLDIAQKLQMPVFIHERDAHDMMAEVLFPRLSDLPGAVIHCFTGNQEQLANYIAQDLYIGITGWICDERRGLGLQEIVANIPLNRILIETDAPFLLPRDLDPLPQSRRNEPKYLPHIMQTIARCMGVQPVELAKVSSENAKTLFSLVGSYE